MEIQPVDDVDLAFGGKMEKLLPAYDVIPKEFKDGHTKWNKFFGDWFYQGLPEMNVTPKDGVDKVKALRHLKAIMGAWQPKHEHKEAGVAYLMSCWFEDVTYTVNK